MIQAEFRVLHEELAELREMVKGGANAAVPPSPRQPGGGKRKSLGRGLDALLGSEGDPWWEAKNGERDSPDEPASPP